jgi:hypothetical protein
MKLADCGPFDEVFTHEDPDTKVIRHFNATHMALYAFMHKFEVIVMGLEARTVEFVRENRGIEPWKVQRLREPFLSRPIILIEYDDTTHLCVDGHHRIVRLWNGGRREVRAWVFPRGQWERFLIEDLPCPR